MILGCLCFCAHFSEDILVFLTGQEEIESIVNSIRDIAKDLPSGMYRSCLNYVHKASDKKLLGSGQIFFENWPGTR